MITVDEALAKVLELAGPPIAEEIDLQDGLGRVLVGPAIAGLTQPPFDAAAMDGYAIRRADLNLPLRVIGEAAAGKPWQGTPEAGTALRIFTGAPVPPGFDLVVMQEHVSRDGDMIRITDRNSNDNIRPKGADFKENSQFFPDRPLTPRDLALIAAMNVARITVARRPRVAIIAGGDELVSPGTVPGPGQIVSSNDIAIEAIARQAGADTVRLPIAEDSVESLLDRFSQAAGADLIVTIGGASVGDHDLIGQITERIGMKRAFYKIAMRPGKPLIAGSIDGAAMLGLPGNPVSAIVCAELFMRPLLRTMQGLPMESRVSEGRLGSDLGTEGDRQHYLRAKLRQDGQEVVVTPVGDQDSARLGLLAEADALLIRPAGDPARVAGETVRFLRLD